MADFDALFFDMDGTLVESKSLARAAFYEGFGKSKTIIDNYGTDLIDCANQLMSQLDENSKYRKKYMNCCDNLLKYMK